MDDGVTDLVPDCVDKVVTVDGAVSVLVTGGDSVAVADKVGVGWIVAVAVNGTEAVVDSLVVCEWMVDSVTVCGSVDDFETDKEWVWGTESVVVYAVSDVETDSVWEVESAKVDVNGAVTDVVPVLGESVWDGDAVAVEAGVAVGVPVGL